MSNRQATVIVVGAGPAGLATSRCLTARGVDHVILERGEVANSWRTERWDSLRLLTPNWMNRLPGDHSTGDDPDGYITATDVVDRLDRYRHLTDAPVIEHTTVTAADRASSGFTVDTDHGRWRSRALVVATGAAHTPRIPTVAHALPATVHQVPALRYRNPGALGSGDVLVVGASASGVQIADEIQRTGNAVTLAVGDHVRLPRTYRDRDIYWWMNTIGLLDERYNAVADIERARRLPSAQLIGTPERRTLDLNTLHAAGVEITGKLVSITGGRAQFSGALANHVDSADLKLGRLLDRIDRHVGEHDLAHIAPADRPEPTRLPPATNEIRLDRYETDVWATGYRPHHPWLDPTLLDRHGRIHHQGGVMDIPGLYALGMPFTRRRNSGLINGIGTDAQELADHLVNHLARQATAA